MRRLAATLLALPLAAPFAHAAMFLDVPSTAWHAPYVELLGRWEVISTTTPFFEPDRSLTRAELAKIVVRARRLDPQPEHGFCDVPSTHWATGYIGALAAAGVVAGQPAPCGAAFAPERPITRAEALKVVLRAFELPPGDSGTTPFADVARDAWYAPYVETAVARKIVSGSNGRFLPDAPVTRAEAAKILVRTLDPSEIYVPGTPGAAAGG